MVNTAFNSSTTIQRLFGYGKQRFGGAGLEFTVGKENERENRGMGQRASKARPGIDGYVIEA